MILGRCTLRCFFFNGLEGRQTARDPPLVMFFWESALAGTIKGGLSVLDTLYFIHDSLTVDSDYLLQDSLTDDTDFRLPIHLTVDSDFRLAIHLPVNGD